MEEDKEKENEKENEIPDTIGYVDIGDPEDRTYEEVQIVSEEGL